MKKQLGPKLIRSRQDVRDWLRQRPADLLKQTTPFLLREISLVRICHYVLTSNYWCDMCRDFHYDTTTEQGKQDLAEVRELQAELERYKVQVKDVLKDRPHVPTKRERKAIRRARAKHKN